MLKRRREGEGGGSSGREGGSGGFLREERNGYNPPSSNCFLLPLNVPKVLNKLF